MALRAVVLFSVSVSTFSFRSVVSSHSFHASDIVVHTQPQSKCFLLVGSSGKVSVALARELNELGEQKQYKASIRTEDEANVKEILKHMYKEANCQAEDYIVVINGAGLAAYSGHPNETLRVGAKLTNVNIKLPFVLAKICSSWEWHLIHMSTTYIFQGFLPLRDLARREIQERFVEAFDWKRSYSTSLPGSHPTQEETDLFAPSGSQFSKYMEIMAVEECGGFDEFMERLYQDRYKSSQASAPEHLLDFAYPLSKLWSEYSLQYWAKCTGSSSASFTFNIIRLPTMVAGGIQNHPLDLNGQGASAKYVKLAIDMVNSGKILKGAICWKQKARNMLSYDDAAKLILGMVNEAAKFGRAGPSMWSGVGAGTWADSDAEYFRYIIEGIKAVMKEDASVQKKADAVIELLTQLDDPDQNEECDSSKQNMAPNGAANTVAQVATYFGARPGNTMEQVKDWAMTTLEDVKEKDLAAVEKDAGEAYWAANGKYWRWMKNGRFD